VTTSESGFWRDPLGWSGEGERTWVQRQLINCRKQQDWIQQTVQMHTRLRPDTLSYESPRWPPSQRCLQDPALLWHWKLHMEILDSLERNDQARVQWEWHCSAGKTWSVERDGRRIALSPEADAGSGEQRVWVYWDPAAGKRGGLIGVDRYGQIASNARVQPRNDDEPLVRNDKGQVVEVVLPAPGG